MSVCVCKCVSMCLCVCAWVWICWYVYVSMFVHGCACTCECEHLRVRGIAQTCKCVGLFVCIGLYATHSHLHTCTFDMHEYICRRKHLHGDTYRKIHTNTFICSRIYTNFLHAGTDVYTDIYTQTHSFCHTHTLTYSQMQTRFKSVCNYACVCESVFSWECNMHACMRRCTCSKYTSAFIQRTNSIKQSHLLKKSIQTCEYIGLSRLWTHTCTYIILWICNTPHCLYTNLHIHINPLV